MQIEGHTWQRKAWRKHRQLTSPNVRANTHTRSYCPIKQPDSEKHWSPELQRKWPVFDRACQDEPVTTFVQPMRQSFMFCTYNRRLISVCWLHYIADLQSVKSSFMLFGCWCHVAAEIIRAAVFQLVWKDYACIWWWTALLILQQRLYLWERRRNFV